MGRRAVVLVIALALAGIAAFAIFQYLQGIEDELSAGQVEVPVYRALAPIAEGTEGSFISAGSGNSLSRRAPSNNRTCRQMRSPRQAS